MSQMPIPENNNVKITTHACDIAITVPGTNISNLTQTINPLLENFITWLTNRNLSLSEDKATTFIFSTWTNEVNLEPNVMVDGTQLPATRNPKILGVTFDNQVNSTNTNKVCEKP